MKWNKIYFLDILWLSFFAYLNFAQPLFADDWYRGHLAALYNGTILDHLINDYLTWTGRMSAQILVYPFLNAPWEKVCTFVFNLLNSLILWGIFRLGYGLVVKERNIFNCLIFSSFFCVFLYLTGFLRNSLWLTGGIQYTWGIFLFLVFVYGYQKKKAYVHPFLLFLLGIFNGFYNEIFFAFAFFVPICYLIFCFFAEKKPIDLNLFSSFWMANLCSGIISIVAPGNYLRKAFEEKEMTDLSYFYRLSHLFESFFTQRHAIVFLFLIGFSIFGLWIYLKKNKISLQVQKAVWIFVFFLISGTFLLFIPVGHLTLEERMLMPFQLSFFLIAFYFFYLYFSLFFYKKYLQISLWLFVFVFMIWHISAYKHLADFHQDRLVLMRVNNQLPIYKAPFWAPKIVSFFDIREDENHWFNRVFADYFGLEKVVGISATEKI